MTSDGAVYSIAVQDEAYLRELVEDLRSFEPVAQFVDADALDGGLLAVGADGGVFALFGADYEGSVPALGVSVASPISAIGISPDEDGYWLVGVDGGVFAFGSASYFGSLPALGVAPAHPIVDLVPTDTGSGYWLVGADGGVFAFGDAEFMGSAVVEPTDESVAVGLVRQAEGYSVIGSFGRTDRFGPVPNFGEYGPPDWAMIPITDVDRTDTGGYLIGLSDSRVIRFGPESGLE